MPAAGCSVLMCRPALADSRDHPLLIGNIADRRQVARQRLSQVDSRLGCYMTAVFWRDLAQVKQLLELRIDVSQSALVIEGYTVLVHQGLKCLGQVEQSVERCARTADIGMLSDHPRKIRGGFPAGR
jgi:hypothetical protein